MLDDHSHVKNHNQPAGLGLSGSRAHISAAFSPRSQMSPLNKKRLDGEGTPTWPWPWPWRAVVVSVDLVVLVHLGRLKVPKKNMGSLGNHGRRLRRQTARFPKIWGILGVGMMRISSRGGKRHGLPKCWRFTATVR